jgi:hypothetical protein
MAEEQVRREVRRMVDSFPRPHGLRHRIAASVPARSRTPRWIPLGTALAVFLLMAAVGGVLLATRSALVARPAATPNVLPGADWSALESRPIPQPKSGVDLAKTCAIGPEFDTDASKGATPPERFFGTYPAAPGRMVQVAGPPSIAAAAPMQLSLASPEYTGAALIRLRAIKAASDGTVGLAASSASGAVRVDSMPRSLSLYVEAPAPGCYAVQIDTPLFTEVIVLQASSGTVAPPAVVATTADQVASYLRGKVTGVDPILLPAAVGANWTAEVSTTETTYSVTYTAPDSRQLHLSTVVPNPPPWTNQTSPRFRGDSRSLYEWQDAAAARTDRILTWEEPKSHWKGGLTVSGQVVFDLSATGSTDAEFWQIANSLQPA